MPKLKSRPMPVIMAIAGALALMRAPAFGAELTIGTGSMALTNGVYQYTAAGTEYDAAALTYYDPSIFSSSVPWTVSLDVSLPGATGGSGQELAFGIAMAPGQPVSLSTTPFVSMTLDQFNNTGATGNTDYPDDGYGTGAEFTSQSSLNNHLATTPLNTSVSYNGVSALPFSLGSSMTMEIETVPAAVGTVTLSYDPTTTMITGYYDGMGVGSYDSAAWGTTGLTVGVIATSQYSIVTTADAETGANFSAPVPEPGVLALLTALVAGALALTHRQRREA